MGRAHGAALGPEVRRNLEIYLDRFAREALLDAAAVRDRASVYAGYLEAAHPAYFEAMGGIAETANVGFLDVVALNVRFEIIYSAVTARALEAAGAPREPDGCTAFVVSPGASSSGHLLMGQNWDWIPEVKGAVVRIGEGGRAILGFTEAGIVGPKIAVNGAGVGLAINGMTSVRDGWSPTGLPFHVRCWDVAHAPSLASAVAAITDGRRPCSANFVVGQAGVGAVDVEAAPDATCVTGVDGGTMVHANHFLRDQEMDVREAPYERRPFSVHRQERLGALLASTSPIGSTELRGMLRDHDGRPDSICRHVSHDTGASRYRSVVSAILDLDDRRAWITDGPPCEAPYVGYSLWGPLSSPEIEPRDQ